MSRQHIVLQTASTLYGIPHSTVQHNGIIHIVSDLEKIMIRAGIRATKTPDTVLTNNNHEGIPSL